MRNARTVLAALALLGCSEANAPASPVAPRTVASDYIFWGMAVDASGACIPGAKVVVVRGQSSGQAVAQTTPCAAWDGEGGFVLEKLIPGVGLTIQVSAPGYASQEIAVVPNGWPNSAIDVVSITLANE